jgi:hypothetical protein
VDAKLSNGEIVENTEAVKLPAATTRKIIAAWDKQGGSTKDLLLSINAAGVAKRYGAGGFRKTQGGYACGGVVKKRSYA